MQIKIYVSNLSKYVEGRENGKWVPLPMEAERLEEVLDKIVGNGKEHIILDYDAPFAISEYENIQELNNFLLGISEYDFEIDILTALFKAGDGPAEVKDYIKNGNFRIVNVDEVSKNWSSGLSGTKLFGMALNEVGYNNLFSQPIPVEMIDYMDFEQIYMCLSVNDGWRDVRSGNTTYLVTFQCNTSAA